MNEPRQTTPALRDQVQGRELLEDPDRVLALRTVTALFNRIVPVLAA